MSIRQSNLPFRSPYTCIHRGISQKECPSKVEASPTFEGRFICASLTDSYKEPADYADVRRISPMGNPILSYGSDVPWPVPR